MKHRITYLILFLCVAPWAISQNDCSMYYPLIEGAEFQITNYDKKDKPTAVIDYKVLDVSSTGSEKVGTMQGTVKDKKGKDLSEMKFKVTCRDNKLSVDFNSLLSPEMVDQFKNMDYDITGTNLDWPNDISVGQTLPDANMTMKISISGMNMTMSMDILNRKVIGKETVTTPAGTFDCYVVTYDTEVDMGIRQKTSSKQWVAKGVGMVKQEDSKNGKIMDTSLLTKFSK
ncbi:hypothetical protein EI546_08545 [Aequorivita sp. H23M31]|uniref:DUF3108 domain-containing protein n=1 Tax=Aequorivita ciconiae TaxID=2494375 RepID=A0A410G3H2_9FLAO|nr:hypothetical protein [Aequorivita sp. H23M31]QAA81765.1 hypothetical protein EI546_08545 [Aequorivita sp. H23M31]